MTVSWSLTKAESSASFFVLSFLLFTFFFTDPLSLPPYFLLSTCKLVSKELSIQKNGKKSFSFCFVFLLVPHSMRWKIFQRHAYLLIREKRREKKLQSQFEQMRQIFVFVSNSVMNENINTQTHVTLNFH